MVGVTLAQIAGGDATRYAAVAALTALLVAGLSALAWTLRLSTLTSFISETILVGFKAGAALSIAAVAPSPSVSSSGCAATRTNAGQSSTFSGGKCRRHRVHTSTGVPPSAIGCAANRTQLVLIVESLLACGCSVTDVE